MSTFNVVDETALRKKIEDVDMDVSRNNELSSLNKPTKHHLYRRQQSSSQQQLQDETYTDISLQQNDTCEPSPARKAVTAPTRTTPVSRKNTSILLNVVVSLILFLALVQFFDPTNITTGQIHTGNDRPNQYLLQHDPVHASLQDFVRTGADHGSHLMTNKDLVGNGREPILDLLKEAGVDVDQLSVPEVERLPLWQTVCNGMLVRH